jgi:hypothetical protein
MRCPRGMIEKRRGSWWNSAPEFRSRFLQGSQRGWPTQLPPIWPVSRSARPDLACTGRSWTRTYMCRRFCEECLVRSGGWLLSWEWRAGRSGRQPRQQLPARMGAKEADPAKPRANRSSTGSMVGRAPVSFRSTTHPVAVEGELVSLGLAHADGEAPGAGQRVMGFRRQVSAAPSPMCGRMG